MKYLKKSLENGLIVLGSVFIIVILLSFLFNKPELLSDNRLYFLFFFIVLVIGKYFMIKREK